MMIRVAVMLFALTSSFMAEAQIYEWRDSNGARNFTNNFEDVPLDQRDAARVIVRANPAVASPVEDAPAANSDAAVTTPERRRSDEPEPPRLAQVIYDHSYRFERRRPVEEMAAEPASTINVNIAGPLAVSQVVVPQTVAAPIDAYEYYGYGGRIPLGLRPHHRKDVRSPDRKSTSPPWVLGPAPISSGSPAFMPAMRSLGPRSVGRR